MTVLYVSQTAANGLSVGSDGGNGSADSPFLTLDRALTAANGGDEIKLNDGNYTPASTLTVSKSVSISSLTSFGATVTAAAGQSSIFKIANRSTVTFGDVTLDANRTASACIDVSGQTQTCGLRLVGTNLLHAVNAGVDGGTGPTAVNITTNGATFSATGAKSFIALKNLAAGAIKIIGGSVTITNQAGDAGGVIDVDASAVGPTVSVHSVTASITGDGENVRDYGSRHYGILLANVPNADVQGNTITISDPSQFATAVPVCVWNDSYHPLNASGATIANNTLRSLAAGGGMIIEVGFDGDPGAAFYGLSGNAKISGNTGIGDADSQAGGLHGIYVGWQAGGQVFDNLIQYADYAYCFKGDYGTTNVYDNRDLDTGAKIYYQKGGSGVAFYDNASVEEAGYNPWSVFVDAVPLRTGGTQDAFGGSAYGNTFETNNAEPRNVDVLAGSSESFNDNTYEVGPGTGQGVWVYGGQTYYTLAAWQAAYEASAKGYVPVFSLTSGALDLAGSTQTLSTPANLAGGTITGGGALIVLGATTIGTTGATGPIITGGSKLETGGAVVQGGRITLGDASGGSSGLYNLAQGIWTFQNSASVIVASGGSGSFRNYGLLNKTGDGTTSVIAAGLNDTGRVIVDSGTLSITGSSNSLSGAIDGLGTISFGAGATSLKAGATATVAQIALAGNGTKLTIAENFAYGQSFTQGAGTTLSIASGDTLTLSGLASLKGVVTGAGALALSGGHTTLTGATAKITALTVDGPDTVLDLSTNLTYAGQFAEHGSSTIELAPGSLTLSGQSSLSGVITGSGRLYTTGSASIGDLDIEGSVLFENKKTVTQFDGDLTLVDPSGAGTSLYNAETGSYAIIDDSAITSRTGSKLTNKGLLEKTGGSGTSVIAPLIANTGRIEAASGTLDLQGRVAGIGTLVVRDGATLQFDAAVAATQALTFAGTDDTLRLTDPGHFAASLSGFASGDVIDLAAVIGSGHQPAFTPNSTSTWGTLTYSDGSHVTSLKLLGTYASTGFHAAPDGHGGTALTYMA